MKNILTLSLALALSSCSLGAQRDATTTYDLGAAPAAPAAQPRIRATVLIHPIAAPTWLDSPAIGYRLNYQDASRQLTYANSRWTAPAAALLTQRLRLQLATISDGGVVNTADSARADYALRVELEEFNQVFDTVESSRAVVVARASIINVARRGLIAQKTFTIQKAAASSNAEGGVRALAGASGEVIEAIVAWTATRLAEDKK